MNIITKSITIIILFTNSLAEDCDKKGILIYEAWGCTSQQRDNSSCPTAFSCPHLKQSPSKCYFKGKSYEIGETLPFDEYEDTCLRCQCQPSAEMKFACNSPSCARPELSLNCRLKFSLDKCCSDEEVCPPFEECVVDGKRYPEGKIFYPDNACLVCLCQKGFELKEPYCKRRICDLPIWYNEGIHKNCALLYKKNPNNLFCCPHNWVCPNDFEKITGSSSGEGCQFGNVTVPIGQKIKNYHFTTPFGRPMRNIECECFVPPLLTCKNI